MLAGEAWRMRRRIIVVLCVVLAILVGFWALLFKLGKITLSIIVDFHPSSFVAKANAGFFYSIGDELKFSDEIDAHSPTLTRGKITDYLVAPDTKRIAVVVNGILLVVDSGDHVVRQIMAVDSIYKEPKPLGRQFFRDTGFQWTRMTASKNHSLNGSY